MEKSEKIEAYFNRDHPFREGIGALRELVLQTDVVETLKWGAPVYTVDDKNVLGIMAFKEHFGLWFFNGVFLRDSHQVLEQAQQGTKALRHWKFRSVGEIDPILVKSYIEEAIENQRQGRVLKPAKAIKTDIPLELQQALKKDIELREKFSALSPYKQREYCEHVGFAKQQKTRDSRLLKCIPMILQGIGLHDKYR